MEKIEDEIVVQEKITEIVLKRHEQISEIKLYFDRNNQQFYKGIARLGQNLEKFGIIYTKDEYKLKCENIISLSLSLGKILDLNNSIKTILLSIKVFEEHKKYINNKSSNDNNKTFISNFFLKNSLIPLSQNNFIKERIQQSINNQNDSYIIMSKFYKSLFGNDSNFFNDLHNYYNFQNESYNNENNNQKEDNNQNKINKIKSITNNTDTFYIRTNICFNMDYAGTIYSACDVFYMLYNKMMDNICYNPNFLSYIEELDEYILAYFIKPCFEDLKKITEIIIKNEVEELNSNLEKIYK